MASSPDSHNGVSEHFSELRIALLGYSKREKSSVGNTILSRRAFDTKSLSTECERRQGAVAGRQVTVVNTPEWRDGYSAQDPLHINKQIKDSVSLCPPGPHAFLIVIPAETLRGTEWTVEELLEVLPEIVWRHTVVLFTSEEKLSETAIEQLIERERCLQQIVEKCGNRYHVLNTTDRADGTQVTELLQKIEEMVAGNSGAYFLLDEALQELREKRRAVEERGKQRLMKVQKQRETLRALLIGESHHLSELRIILLGRRGLGKSAAVNTILGREEFDTKSHTTECAKAQGSVAGRQVTVIDTPGWNERCGTEETPEQVKQEIKRGVSLFAAEPHALLLVIDVTESFTESGRRAVEEHLELFSDRVWRHTLVLFTRGEWLTDTTIEQHIERWTALQWLIDKCGNSYHVLNYVDLDDDIQVTELLEKIEEMVAGNYLWNVSLTEYLESEERNRELKQRNEEIERESEDMKKICDDKEREINKLNHIEKEREEMEIKYKEKERRVEEMEEEFKRKMEEMTQKTEEIEQKLRREVKELKDREEKQHRETEEMKKRNKGKEEEISQLKEELCKLQKEKEESTAPVRNIVEMDLYMSGERIPGSTELMSQEEEDRQRDRERQMQREEEELRAQHQAEQEERERRMTEEMRRREENLIKPLEEKIQDLEERLRGERDEQRRRELEGELRREREQREKLEREEERRRDEEQRERREREERQRAEMEVLRQRYRQEAREDAGRYMIGGAVVLGAAIGAIAGALRGPLGAAAGTAIGAVAGAQLGALIRGGERDGGKRREERRSSTKQSTPSVRGRNSPDYIRPNFLE